MLIIIILFKVYTMTKKKRGFCLIINNEEFDENHIHRTRTGSSVDAQNLHDLFSQLGFEVRMPLIFASSQNSSPCYQVIVHKNLTFVEVNEIIWKLAVTPLNCEMFIAAVLSHGSQGIFYTKDGRKFGIERFLEPFNNLNCRHLIGVPKFFLFQACR